MAKKRLTPWQGSNSEPTVNKLFDKVLKNYGHYVLYRRYNIGTKSEFYSDASGQGVGGPKWTYEDEVMKVRHDPMSIRGAVGTTIQKSKMYLPKTSKPKRGDVVIELNYDDSDANPSEYTLFHSTHREAFEIDEIDVKRGPRGRISFYLVSVVPHLGDY
tara:strand:- start:79 stop:555 length:477 start_codon:yes stop_codon:yes gene_type:complete